MICRRSCNFIVNGALSSRHFTRQASNVALDNSEALRPLEDFTRRLIDASATGESNHKHRDGAKLWSAIPQAAQPNAGPPSIEKSQFLAQNRVLPPPDVDPLKSDLLSDNIHPGMFVELRRNRVITHGVVLQLQIIESRMHSFTLTYTGEMWPHLVNDITYTVPNFVSQDLMHRAGTAFEAANTAETVARLQVVEQIRTFTRRHERHFNSMGKDITTLYDKVRHPDTDRWTDITTPEATRHLDVRKPPPILTLFSVHTHMMSRPLYFVADPRNHKTTHRFSIRPLSHVQIILQINDWVRSRDPVFQSFLKKARIVIKEARRIRHDHGEGPLSRATGRLPTWSASDLTFIRYLQNALRTTRTTQEDPYDHALPTIVKNMGLYNDQIVGPGLAHTILSELGVISPWDDVVTRTPELRLDIAPPGESKEAQALNELVDHNLHSPASLISSILRKKLSDVRLEGSTELYQRDPHEAVRRDFCDMPVYVVDDIGAKELDDGLSIEPVAGEQGNYWVHVHVADPTTVIPPGHVFDLRARENGSTLYSSHRTWPMLPPALTQPLFSLGSKAKGEAQEVLTFSMKVSNSGDFLDYAVTCGLVRNLHILQYDQVDHLLGTEHSFRTYPLPGARQPTVTIDPVPESCRSDLRQLYELAARISRRTVETRPVLLYAFPRAAVEFESRLPMNPILSPEPILWKGYPRMNYHVENYTEFENSFRSIVGEWMKLACRAASRFCRDKGLPAIRRTSTPLRAASEEAMAEILAMRSPTGFVDAFECMKRNVYAPPGEPALAPLEHWSLGIPKGEGYCRVTSPLRRYVDLIMHWQIKHELLPASDRTTKGPLFPEEYLKPIMYRQFDKEKAMNSAETLYNKHWSFACLARYNEEGRQKHGPDFNSFSGLLARTTGPIGFDTVNMTGQVSVAILSLGVQGILKGVDQRLASPIGTTFSVKIAEFNLGLAPTLILNLA